MKHSSLPMPIRRTLVPALAIMSLSLVGCIESDTSPVVRQAETARLAGSVTVLNDADAVGGKALKLPPRHGAWVAYMPGELPVAAVSVRLSTDGCAPATGDTRPKYIKYTLNFQPNATGSALVQIGPVRTLWYQSPDFAPSDMPPGVNPPSPWTTVTAREGLAGVNQNGRFELRVLAHEAATGLPASCGLLVDQGSLRGTPTPGFAGTTGPGKPRFMLRTNGDTDAWMDNAAYSNWNAAHYHRAEVHRPHADGYLPWFNGGLVYFKSHAVQNNADIPNQAWILKSASGVQARVKWSGGSCNFCQAALDIGNPEVRTWLINRAKAAVAGPNNKAFKGLWVDDVNMTLGLASSSGQDLVPIDPRTGQPMTDANWQRYMAEWMEALRAALPTSVEIFHNAKYYWGTPTYTQRQVRAATGIHLEGGFSDYYLGKDPWVDSPYSVAALGRYIKMIHDQGRAVIMDSGASSDRLRDYGLAAYFIFAGDQDMLSNWSGNAPTDWWPGYDTDLGAALTATPTAPTSSGLWRRDFANGIALMVQPTGLRQAVRLSRAMVDTSGRVYDANTDVWIEPRQAAVLTYLPANGVGGGGVTTNASAFTF